ncbi:MAG: hypothetical protein HUK13_09905 [Muribaculaceae bacterium]|nr:hypothetical protein [Muribaculaceae bacterium]
MVLINFTNDPKLQPAGNAIDLFEKTLLFDNLYPFCPASYIMWGEWLSGQDETWSKIPYKYKNCEWLVLQSIPIFIVNRDFCGKTIYCPALKRDVTVPDNRLPNITLGMGRHLEEESCVYDEYGEDHDSGFSRKTTEPSSYIDTWACFTVLKDSSKPHSKYEMGGMPAVFVWMDKIIEATDSNEQANMLFALTMLHETGHALMHNGIFYNDEIHNWCEEALANAYALGKIAMSHDTRFYDFATEVVMKQPANYALGAKLAQSFGLHEIKHLMEIWTDMQIRHASKELRTQLMNYVKTAKTLDLRTLSSFYKQVIEE